MSIHLTKEQSHRIVRTSQIHRELSSLLGMLGYVCNRYGDTDETVGRLLPQIEELRKELAGLDGVEYEPLFVVG